MNVMFYVAAAVAVACTVRVVTHLNGVHALLYFVVSLFAVATIFYLIGAPFVAALELIVYAGAIMVLFVFVVMLLNRGPQAVEQERGWLNPRMWVGPTALSLVLAVEVGIILFAGDLEAETQTRVDAKQVGITMLGPYLLAVEIASMLLLAGLVGAYHLGRRETGRAVAGEER
jgi:NADH-quinone oxidoreductase subunit J